MQFLVLDDARDHVEHRPLHDGKNPHVFLDRRLFPRDIGADHCAQRFDVVDVRRAIKSHGIRRTGSVNGRSAEFGDERSQNFKVVHFIHGDRQQQPRLFAHSVCIEINRLINVLQYGGQFPVFPRVGRRKRAQRLRIFCNFVHGGIFRIDL